MTSRLSPMRMPIAFATAVATAAIAVWTFIPPPIFLCIPLRIAATELSPWLAVLALISLALAAAPAAARRLRLATFALATIAVALSAYPYTRFAQAERSAEAAMMAGLGSDWQECIPVAQRAAMRPRPFSVLDGFAGIDVGDALVTRDVLVAEPDGVALRADILRPPTGAAHPVIVAIHGGGWRHGFVAEGETINRYLAAHGYVVVSIDYRRSPTYRFPVQLDDVHAAIAWVLGHAGEYSGDATRLVLMGRSAGAELALLAAYADHGPPVQAVVSWYGPVDLAGAYRDPPHLDPLDVPAILRDFLGGTPDELPDAYCAASPMTFTTQRRPASLLLTGASDHAVGLGFQRRLVERLRFYETPAVLIEIPWAEHAFDAIANGPAGQLALFHLERFLAWALAR